MRRSQLLNLATIAFVVPIAVSACKAQQSALPERQTMTAPQPKNDAVSVSGCLRAGVAENTFVLNSTQAQGETATYQLIGNQPDALRDHVGEQVEISGTLRSEQTVATSGTVEEKPAKGTLGKPIVKTRAELDVKTLTVDSVRPTGNRCAE